MGLRHVGTAALAALAAACGTTVPIGQQAAVSQGGLAVQGSTGAASGTAGSGGPVSVGSTGTTAGGAVPGSGSAGAAGAPGQPTGGGGASATAVVSPRHAPVQLGMVYIPDASAFAASVGISGSTGDEQAEGQAAVDWVNAHGGLAGHRIVPVYYSLPLESAQPYADSLQAACSSFTQDHHVVAATFPGANVPANFPACLDKAGVAFVGGGLYMHDQTDYRQYPNMVSPYEADSGRVARALLAYLFGRSFFHTGDHVGVMIGNWGGSQRAYRNVLEPTLKAHGVQVSSYTVDAPTSTPDIGAEAQQVQNDELHMRADGVTVVIFFMPGPEAVFMNDAESQHWRPRYALTTYDNLSVLEGNGGAPAAQLQNAVGIGWEPSSDVTTYGVQGGPGDNATRRTCRHIEQAQVKNNDQELFANQYCDAVLFLRAAAEAANTSDVTGATLLQGFNSLGSTHPSAMTMATYLSAQQHAGAAAYQPLAFLNSCTCFRYIGGPAQLPQP